MVDDFDDWYAHLRPSMGVALSAWCGDGAVAAEALDEAFVRAIERWERVRSLDSPAGWVWATASNVARRHMKRRGQERTALRALSATTAFETAGPNPDDLDLRCALLALTERQRTVVVLHYLADLSVRDVALALGIAEGTVSATLHQSRARLLELLAPRNDEAVPTRHPEPTSHIDGVVP